MASDYLFERAHAGAALDAVLQRLEKAGSTVRKPSAYVCQAAKTLLRAYAARRPPPQKPPGPPPRRRGVCQWFDPERKHGFIKPDGGAADLFVHQMDLRAGTEITQGDAVEFGTADYNGRDKAVDVTKVERYAAGPVSPLPDGAGPCDNGFVPTCEQVHGFGLCDMHAVAQACPDTCSTTVDTSGHHLHEENIMMQPIDYMTPVLDPEVNAIVCGVCRDDPDLACCHNHPHRARARRLSQSSCKLAAANSRTRCGAAAAATITGLTSLARRYLRNAIERANAASTNTSAMRGVPALSYAFLVDEVQAHVDEVKELKNKFSAKSDVQSILDAIGGLYTVGEAKVAGDNSVLVAREAQLDKQLQWALTAVGVAQDGMEETDKKMKEKLEKLQAAVKAHMVAQLISGIFSMLFSFAEVCPSPASWPEPCIS